MKRARHATALLIALAAPVRAQVITNSTATPMGRALMAERSGAYANAAAEYLAILATQPASVPALAGLERVLPPLDRRPELLPLLNRALASDSTSNGILGMVVRAYATARQVDSARKYADRWATVLHGDEDAYREWSQAALDVRDLAQARVALDAGRERLGPKVLGVERAELYQRAGDVTSATSAWVAVVADVPNYIDGAVSMLAQTLPAQRPVVRDNLAKSELSVARQMLALLQAAWGEPTDAVATVRHAIPTDTVAAVNLLQQLYARIKSRGDKASQLAGAATLELMAERQPGAPGTASRMEAARVYADAGDERNARRLLSLVAATPGAAGASTAASTALIGVLLAEGRVADAEQSLKGAGARLDPDEHDRLTRRVAFGWARSGDLARAESLVENDSTTQGLDLRGRLRLLRGDLAAATTLLKQAGPYDDVRAQAIDRVTLLALLQSIGADSLPALGQAYSLIIRGDTAKGVDQLAMIAGTLAGTAAAETRLYAASLALAHRDSASALALYRLADVKDVPAAAANARLQVAAITLASGHPADARAMLEQLILDFPDSAVVPEARRLRDTIASAGAR